MSDANEKKTCADVNPKLHWPGLADEHMVCSKCGGNVAERMIEKYKRGHAGGKKFGALLDSAQPGSVRQMWEILNYVLIDIEISSCDLNRLRGFHSGLHSYLFTSGQL